MPGNDPQRGTTDGRGGRGRGGLDVGCFASASYLASWAVLCPGSHESAGKHKTGKRCKGDMALRRALSEATHAAARTKREVKTAVATQYRRLVVRCGKQQATVAVGHRILRIVYHMLSTQEVYHDLAPTYLDDRRRARARRHALDQLHTLGFEVTITSTAPA